MLGPFKHLPFFPWCQRDPLLTHPKKDSPDISWPLSPLHSVNGCTPKDEFLGVPKKMNLPLAEDLCSLIHKSGRGCYMYSTDIPRVYWQLLLDTGDWPLVSFNFDSYFFFVDISLPFGLR